MALSIWSLMVVSSGMGGDVCGGASVVGKKARLSSRGDVSVEYEAELRCLDFEN